MKTSIATVSISGDLADKLQAIAAAGFDGVEIFENDLLTFGGSPKDAAKMARDLGLEITLFQPFRDFEGLPEPLRARAFDRAERKFDIMQELGCDLILICSSVHPEALGGIDRAAADFRELGERAKARNLRVGYEALAWGRHINDHRDAWEIVRRADHPNVGLILDSFHTLARKIDVASIRSIPGDRIFIVQLADAPKIDMDLLYWSRHFRNMPGEGDLAVTDFVRAVMATGYSGPLSLEVFNDQFRGGSPKAIAVDGHRSLTYLIDQVARAEPALCLDVPKMPPRIEVKGVAFVEFATDEVEGARAVGHAEAARLQPHRPPPQQERRTLPPGRHQHRPQHRARRPRPLDLRHPRHFRLRHRPQGRRRGRHYRPRHRMGATIFEQPVAEGELKIPAIRGVGGGVIYFIDDKSDLARVWDIEFVPVDDAPSPGAGLTSIDHIAQTMNYEEMLTWVLFYTSIFATAKSPMVDVLDPSGLIRSQVIENAEGSLRLTLNGAENSRTIAGRFISETFGSSVQHLAFASSDIFATAAAMAAAGFRILEIPPNYYDDLAARFGLDAATAEQAARRQHPLRPRRRRRVLPVLRPDVRRRFLLRDRRAPRLSRLRRPQRPLPHRRTKASDASGGHAALSSNVCFGPEAVLPRSA